MIFFYSQENNLKTRRNLRGQIERRNLDINNDFLSAFKVVKESLDGIHNNVKQMSNSCKQMQVGIGFVYFLTIKRECMCLYYFYDYKLIPL